MADEGKKKKVARETSHDGLVIRAKGQLLRLPLEITEGQDVASGSTGHAHPQIKGKKKKLPSRRVQRKKAREEKKVKKHQFFSNRSKKQQVGSDNAGGTGKEDKERETKEKGKKKRKKKRKRKLKTENAAEKAGKDKLLKVDMEDEKEIKKLEKLLKLKRKKQLPSAFQEDGLDYLLEVCEPLSKKIRSDSDSDDLHSNPGKLDSEGRESVPDSDKSESENETDLSEKEAELMEEGNFVDSDKQESDGYFSSGQETETEKSDADTVSSAHEEDSDHDTEEENDKQTLNKETGLASKYIPPHFRTQAGSEVQTEKLNRIKKQIKGLLNRLSESNLQAISGAVEEKFMHHSRNDMNQVLTDLILSACIATTLMPEKLIMEHIMLLTVLHVHLGMEVGAFFLQTLTQRFDGLHRGAKYGEGKECFNIILLFSHLYNFKLIDSSLIYDIIRRLADSFSDQDIELLLLLLKSTGAEIRRDDPASLKEIILQIQTKAASFAETNTQSRVRFMLEIISALKNNNLRKIPGYDPSQVEHLRKALRTVIRDPGRLANCQLKISLQDLLDADTKGRWWIVGSSWSGRVLDQVTGVRHQSTQGEHSKLLEIARKQRMNTDVRKNIFCAVMSSEDYIDAFEKLLRLNLKDVQAREIVHVLIDCCLQEKTYNPFYSYVGQKFCEYSRSYQVTFQYTFWDRFKVIPELNQHNVSNMAHMLSHLVAVKALSLSILKVVNFAELEKPSIKFFRQFLLRLLLDYPEHKLRESFERIGPLQDLSHLRQSLRIFIRHFIRKHKQTMDNENNRKRNLESRLKLVDAALHS